MLWILDLVCLSIGLDAKEGNCDDGPFQPYHKHQIMPSQMGTVVLNKQHQLSTTAMDSQGKCGRGGENSETMVDDR